MLQLNADQQSAVEAFIGFMLSDDKEFVISGMAGVGKTTLLKHLMELKTPQFLCGLMGKRPIEDWALTATTNKAAEVLSEATGLLATTIHSYLGLSVINDFDTGTQRISRKANSPVIHNTLIIVDEASMVDTPLRRLIHEGTMNCKILYVGDHCQMAPVTEAISPVFADNKTIALNTIIRAANAPPIMELCLKLRETVETGVFFNIKASPGFIDFLSHDEARNQIEQTFLASTHADARILCYTNNKVIQYNNYLRKKRNLPEEFTQGEWVVSNGVCKAMGSRPTNMLRVEEEVEILNTEELADYNFTMGGTELYSIRNYAVRTNRGMFRVPFDGNQHRAVMKEVARQAKNNPRLWPTFFDLKEDLADLRPRDACTVYKAQGSTYHTVFVDLEDIGDCRNPAQAARMLYVACSRPTHRICFLGQLPNRFRGM